MAYRNQDSEEQGIAEARVQDHQHGSEEWVKCCFVAHQNQWQGP